MKKLLPFILITLFLLPGASAQTATDSVRIYYKQGHREIDIGYKDNRTQPERFLQVVRDAYQKDIIDHTSEWIYDDNHRIIDGKKKQLMDLNAGTQTDSDPQAANGKETGNETTDTATDTQPVDFLFAANGEMTAAQKVKPEGEGKATEDPVQRLAIKTNLLYDALLMPSLEVEYRINERWSVNLEGDMAWWKNDGKHKYYQLATVSPEGRYWFKTRKPWHGHYVGVFGGFTWYDLENGKRGYKGEAETAGLSYGYMFPVGKRISLEAGVGVGFLHTRYEEYLPLEGHYVYQQTKQTNYFGPLKLKFALVWRLWNEKKKREIQ